jgi:hypothetical protein
VVRVHFCITRLLYKGADELVGVCFVTVHSCMCVVTLVCLYPLTFYCWVKNMWNHAFTPPYWFSMWCSIKHRDSCIFTFMPKIFLEFVTLNSNAHSNNMSLPEICSSHSDECTDCDNLGYSVVVQLRGRASVSEVHFASIIVLCSKCWKSRFPWNAGACLPDCSVTSYRTILLMSVNVCYPSP